MRLTQHQAQKRSEAAARVDEAARARNMDALPPGDLVMILGERDTNVSGAAFGALLARGATASLPALIHGLDSHASGRVRAACALLMDHLADARCVAPLTRAIKSDPIEAVRRCALHSLACDGCKTCPLPGDVVGPIAQAALGDRSLAVRRRAVFYLGQRGHGDGRAEVALRTILAGASDADLRRRAQNALARLRL